MTKRTAIEIETELGVIVTNIWRLARKANNDDHDLALEIIHRAFAYSFQQLTTFEALPIATKIGLLDLARVFGPQFELMYADGRLATLSPYDIVSALR